MERIEFQETGLPGPVKSDEVLALDDALQRFAMEEPEAARLVELRFFVGLSHQEAARVLGLSRRVADGLWAYARAWLLAEMRDEPGKTRLPRTGGTGS
jgi:DNA-directed RNA polymerase specialized sigma24 family protein